METTTITLPTKSCILIDGESVITDDLLQVTAYLDDIEARRLKLDCSLGFCVSTVHFGMNITEPDQCYETLVQPFSDGQPPSDAFECELRKGMSKAEALSYHNNVLHQIKMHVFAGGRLTWRQAKKRHRISGQFNKEGRRAAFPKTLTVIQ